MAINDKITDLEYWEGVLDTCTYFVEQLGIEDALDTSIALQAIEELHAAGVN